MFRHRQVNRLGAAASAAVLLLSALGVGGAAAANTRFVYFGSPDGTGGDRDSNGNLISGTLTFSSVTVGGRSATQLLIRNDGGQTLNHIRFAGGSVADDLPYNPGFTVVGTNPPSPTPAGDSIPAEASFAAVFKGADLAACDPSSGDGIMCDVGTLSAHTSASYTIVIAPPGAAGSYHVWLTVSWNEGWSTTGSNADYQFAEGDIVVGTASCDTATSNYFLPGETVDLENGGGTCRSQDASIASGNGLVGAGGHASVKINDDIGFQCPASVKGTCYGATVEAEVLAGAPVPGGVEWTVTWHGIKSLSGVIHFLDGYTPGSNLFDDIPLTNKFKCSASLPTNCWVDGSKIVVNGSPSVRSFTVTFRTPKNGRGGGYT